MKPASSEAMIQTANNKRVTSGGAWVVGFGNGVVNGGSRGSAYYVRLVRAGQ